MKLEFSPEEANEFLIKKSEYVKKYESNIDQLSKMLEHSQNREEIMFETLNKLKQEFYNFQYDTIQEIRKIKRKKR